MGELNAPVCSGRNPKRRFPNKLAAEIALADIQRAPAKFPKKPTRAYECGICRGWHLTSEPLRRTASA